MSNKPSYSEGIVVAIILALCGMIIHAGFAISGLNTIAMAATVSIITSLYSLYVVSRASSNTGRLTTFLLTSSTIAVLWIGNPGLWLFLIAHLLVIATVRVFYLFPKPIHALLDIGIHLMALLCAVWAYHMTGSVFLATWSFFLLQTLLSVIHSSGTITTGSSNLSTDDHEKLFSRAKSQAESALSQLTTKP